MPTIPPICHLVAIPMGDGCTVVGPFATMEDAQAWYDDHLLPVLADDMLKDIRFAQMFSPEHVEQHMLFGGD
jgi:hypothetical protein